MIIVVGNEKGGTGKTTVAVNLAAMAVRNGHDVLLVDADPGQQSAAKWVARREEGHGEAPAIQCVTLTGKNIEGRVRDLQKRYRLVIIDTGAVDSQELRACAVVADRFVVPVQGEAFDFWCLPTVEHIFSSAQKYNDRLRCKIILNRIPHQLLSVAPKEAESWVLENTPSLPSRVLPVVSRTAYGKASAEGLAVWEMPKRDPKAATEMQRLYREVIDGDR